MPLFYFHVRQQNTRYEDPQGVELHDVQAAWEHALRDARYIAQTGLLSGSPDEHWMEITDPVGKVVAILPFTRALATH